MREEEGVSTGTYQTLSAGGGVADGEMASSPGCSGIRVSAGEPGPCMPGGVEEALRASVAEPLRDTQEVSITRTPILETNTHTESYMMMRKEVSPGSEERSGGKGIPLYLPNAALVEGEERQKGYEFRGDADMVRDHRHSVYDEEMKSTVIGRSRCYVREVRGCLAT